MKQKHSNRLCSVIVSIIVILLVLIAVSLFWVNSRLCFVDYTPYSYSESGDAIKNPYVGLYSIRGYLLAEDATFSLPEANAAIDSNSSSFELSLLEINLKNYGNCDLSDNALSQIDSILSAWTKTGSQLILRFLYDWDGQNLKNEPNELSQILTHMEQVGPIVNKYASSVYIMQGIFVGNWGEMNNTTHMGNGEMETLIQKLDDVIDPSIFLSVRTPAQLRTIVGEYHDTKLPHCPQPNLLSSLSSRLGLYNDGMLGSANDIGTYGDKTAADLDTNYYDAWTREDELAFQNNLCRYVPNGGEVIIDNVYNDFDNAVKDLSQMHVSYLNSEYDSTVLNKWKATIVNGTDNVWNGMSGYDYIERHLGYRYILDSSSLKFHPLFDDTGMLTVTIRNVGFSNCYRPLEASVYVVSDLTGDCVAKVPIDTDPRLWNSGESSTFTVPIDVRSLRNKENNTYTLYLKCSDTALNRTILFANTQTPTKYGYELGSIGVKLYSCSSSGSPSGSWKKVIFLPV